MFFFLPLLTELFVKWPELLLSRHRGSRIKSEAALKVLVQLLEKLKKVGEAVCCFHTSRCSTAHGNDQLPQRKEERERERNVVRQCFLYSEREGERITVHVICIERERKEETVFHVWTPEENIKVIGQIC